MMNPSVMPKSKSEYVAQRLLEWIIQDNLTPGSTLGTEADLLAQYDVSRPTLRESLRILEAQGVVELRPGPKGGILVTQPGMNMLAHGLSVYLRLHDVPFIEVLKAREAIEPALAASAAEHADAADIAALQASVDRMRRMTEQADFVEENRIFHSLIADASRNKVMAIFWSTISIMAGGESHGITYSERNRQHVIDAHQSILDAISAHDAARAASLMQDHLMELERLLGRRYQNLATRATEIVNKSGRRIA